MILMTSLYPLETQKDMVIKTVINISSSKYIDDRADAFDDAMMKT